MKYKYKVWHFNITLSATQLESELEYIDGMGWEVLSFIQNPANINQYLVLSRKAVA